MDFIDFTAADDDSDKRLWKVLKHIMEARTGAVNQNVFALLRKNLVRLNDKKADGSERLASGDKISVAKFLLGRDTPGDEQKRPLPEGFTVATIFRNRTLWIINKPAGISSQKDSAGGFCLSDYVSAHSASSSLSFRAGPLHRLDKYTSGLLCFSQSTEGARWFSRNMKDHLIEKTYFAVLENTLPSPRMRFSDDIEGKSATTYVEELSRGSYRGKDITLVKAEIQSGRKHQIRIHCALGGFPLLGDAKYGGSKSNGYFLHARKMTFPENTLGIPPEVTAPVPASWRVILPCFPDIPPEVLSLFKE